MLSPFPINASSSKNTSCIYSSLTHPDIESFLYGIIHLPYLNVEYLSFSAKLHSIIL